MKLRKIMSACALAIPALAAANGATATKTEQCGGWDNEACETLTTITINVNVASADRGRPGAFFVAAREVGGSKGMWIRSSSGWLAFDGGRYEPFSIEQSMSGQHSLVPVNRENLCLLMQDDPARTLELWAGYGVLTTQREAMVNDYHKISNPSIPSSHIRSVYVFDDMRHNEKYWQVMRLDGCKGSTNDHSGL